MKIKITLTFLFISLSASSGISDMFFANYPGLLAISKGRVETKCKDLDIGNIVLENFSDTYSLKEVELIDYSGVNSGKTHYTGEATKMGFFIDRDSISGQPEKYIVFGLNLAGNLESAIFVDRANNVSINLCQ